MIIGQPPPELRNPLELSLYVGLFAFTFGTAVGTHPLPGSLQNQTDLYGQSAAALIAAGSLVSAVGLLWLWDRMDAFIVYQLGCVGLGIGCGMYALALFWVLGPTVSAVTIGVFGGLSIGCLGRWWQINRWWRRERLRARELLNGGSV